MKKSYGNESIASLKGADRVREGSARLSDRLMEVKLDYK